MINRINLLHLHFIKFCTENLSWDCCRGIRYVQMFEVNRCTRLFFAKIWPNFYLPNNWWCFSLSTNNDLRTPHMLIPDSQRHVTTHSSQRQFYIMLTVLKICIYASLIQNQILLNTMYIIFIKQCSTDINLTRTSCSHATWAWITLQDSIKGSDPIVQWINPSPSPSEKTVDRNYVF